MKTIHLKTIAFIVLLSFCVFNDSVTQNAVDRNSDIHYFRKFEQSRFAQFLVKQQSEDPEKIEQQRKFDVTYYGLNLSIDPVSRTISGSVNIQARSDSDSLTWAAVDLNNSMTVDSVNGDNVSIYEHLNGLLKIYFTDPLPVGQTFDITVNYSGTPNPLGFGSFVFGTRYGSREPLIWTLSEPFYARTWWPCKDMPEDKADSVDIVITVPENLTAVSNGLLTNTVNNGDGTKTYFWHEKYPVSAYLLSLAISDYDYYVEHFRYSETDSMPVEFYITPEKSPGAFGAGSGLPQTVQILEVFSELFGIYPFIDEKYAQVEFGWGGGMEHQTATGLGLTFNGANIYLVSHELAHQWWGDMITCRDWHHIWLNEGFATYSEGLYIEALGGKFALFEYMNIIKQPVGVWATLFVESTDDLMDIFSNTVYDKGAWALHMLRGVVGDENFFEILRAYASDPSLKYGTAVTEDFQAVCETVYGGGLDWFFDQWVYSAGRPQYQYSWTLTRINDLYKVTLSINQVQSGRVFTMPLEIFLKGINKTRVETVMNNEINQEYTFSLDFPPVSVTIDDSAKILKEIVFVNSGGEPVPAGTPAAFTLFQNYPNPFNLETTIIFETLIPAHVTVEIFSARGQKIKTIFSGRIIPSLYKIVWDGLNDSGIPAAAGIYFVRMASGGFVDVKKMALIR